MDTTFGRYILRFSGGGPMPADDLARIGALEDVTVIDRSSPRMLLVEASGAALRKLVDNMPGWMMYVEAPVSLPQPDLRVRGTGKGARRTQSSRTRGVQAQAAARGETSDTSRTS